MFHGWRFDPDGAHAAADSTRSSTSTETGRSVNPRTARRLVTASYTSMTGSADSTHHIWAAQRPNSLVRDDDLTIARVHHEVGKQLCRFSGACGWGRHRGGVSNEGAPATIVAGILPTSIRRNPGQVTHRTYWIALIARVGSGTAASGT